MVEYKNIVKPKIITDENDKNKHAVVHFSGMREMLECIEQGDYHFDNNGSPGSSREKFTYGKTIVGRDNVNKHLRMGKTADKFIKQYHKQRAMLERKAGIKQFLGRGLSCKRRRVYCDNGDDLSMSRLMGGNDNYWSTTVRESQRANIRIGMNMAISWEHNENDFIRLGASLAVISDVLTKLGYAVEVICYNFVKYRGANRWDYFGMSIPIKMPNEPLDIHRLLTGGIQGLFRDKCFGLMRKAWKFGYGMGYQTRTTDLYKKELQLIHVVEQDMCETDKQAVDGLSDMMRKLSDKPVWMK